MWILKEEDKTVVVELESNETETGVREYLKKYYGDVEYKFISTTGPIYHKVEDIYPHVNVMDVNKIRRF